VTDNLDRCPAEAGPADNQGCPLKDSDGDGLLDNADQCPQQPEDLDMFEDQDGCPDLDNDKDGIPDEKDQCRDEPETINGFKDDDGCPDKGKVLVIIRAEKIEILDKIYFDTARATIQPRSFKLLDQIAQTLRGHEEIKKIRIEGHTDSQGPDESNLKLSQKRADAVKDYLIKKGQVDPARLESVGYGETRAIAPNNTVKGREQNRRVEFVILQDQ
jgi:large repetitive protein